MSPIFLVLDPAVDLWESVCNTIPYITYWNMWGALSKIHLHCQRKVINVDHGLTMKTISSKVLPIYLYSSK